MAALSQATSDAIQRAVDDEAAALAALQASKDADAAASAADELRDSAHQQAASSGMAALRAFAEELNIPLPAAAAG